MSPHSTPEYASTPLPLPAVAPEREIREVGPTTGAISLPIGQGMVFVSADGSWGRLAS